MTNAFDLTNVISTITAPVDQYFLWIFIVGVVALLLFGSGRLNVGHGAMDSIDPQNMVAIITVMLIGASLFVILSKQYESADKHWAYGTIGTLIGYWFRPHAARSGHKKPR